MIEITLGKMYIPENERFIGFAGDNLHSTKTFLLKDIDETNCIYRLYLTFDDGTTNYFLLDSKVENGSTYLTWNILENHIMKSGIVKAQIKAFCENERIFHTTYDYFIVAPTAEYDQISERENSEFLEYERRLNEILSYINTHEYNFVPVDRTIAGLSLSDDITTELLCSSLRTYPILNLSKLPTKSTVGKKGQLAFVRNMATNNLYFCSSVSEKGEYTWERISSNNLSDDKVITDILINDNGELEITLLNGEKNNLGKVIGEDGADGYTPVKGIDYFDGEDGQDGKTPVIGVDYFTESDKAEIVQSVIDSLGGNPVCGVVDENNNIVVSGNLGNGTYTVKYELEDGSTILIGELVLTDDSGNSGDAGDDKPAYTNLADPTSDEWLEGYRINSSGVIEATSGVTLINTIPCVTGDTIRVKGVTNINVAQYKNGVFYNRSTIDSANTQYSSIVVDGDYNQFTIAHSDITSIRFYGVLSGTADDVIITKNEEIV